MRHTTILVAILAFGPLASATAQVPLRPGERVRVTLLPLCPPNTLCAKPPRQSEGTFLAWEAYSLVVQSNGNALALPLDSVTKLEVHRGPRLSSQGAAIGAAVGGGFLLYASGNAAAGALGAGLGALLGRSPRARMEAGIGLLAGAFSGAFIGLASGDDPPGFLSFTAEEKAALGAFVFGGLGGVIGLIAGTASPGERWEEVPLDQLRVSFGPQRDGPFGLGLLVRF